MKRELEDLAQILGSVEVGTADNPRRVRRIDLAVQRAQEWRAERLISGDSSRGGSSSPAESDDRKEERSLDSQIGRDLLVLQRALDAIKELPAVRAAVARYCTTIDHSKLPQDSSVPGCTSCARREGVGGKASGGYFAPVIELNLASRLRGKDAGEAAVKAGLCRWCWDFACAHDGLLPPMKAIDLMHRQSPRAAGVWLAKQGQQERKTA